MSETSRLLVVVAHPDDETFGCGSLLRRAADAGVRTAVVCATRGEAGELAPAVGAPEGIAALREAELHAAARRLGVGSVEVLGFTDSGMDGEPGPTTLCGAAVEDVAAAVGAAIARHAPDVVVTLDGSDGHRDHRRLREVIESLVLGTSTVLYLHCLPRSLMHDWIRHHAGDDGAAAYTELPEIGTPDDLLTTVLDTRDQLADREAAIALHRSQRSPFEGLPDDLRRAFLTREHLIRVQPAPPRRTDGPGAVEHELHGLATRDPAPAAAGGRHDDGDDGC